MYRRLFSLALGFLRFCGEVLATSHRERPSSEEDEEKLHRACRVRVLQSGEVHRDERASCLLCGGVRVVSIRGAGSRQERHQCHMLPSS